MYLSTFSPFKNEYFTDLTITDQFLFEYRVPLFDNLHLSWVQPYIR